VDSRIENTEQQFIDEETGLAFDQATSLLLATATETRESGEVMERRERREGR